MLFLIGGAVEAAKTMGDERNRNFVGSLTEVVVKRQFGLGMNKLGFMLRVQATLISQYFRSY